MLTCLIKICLEVNFLKFYPLPFTFYLFTCANLILVFYEINRYFRFDGFNRL